MHLAFRCASPEKSWSKSATTYRFLPWGFPKSFCLDSSIFSISNASGNWAHIIRSISSSLAFDNRFFGRLLSSKESGFQSFLGILDVCFIKKQHPNVMNYCGIPFRRLNLMLRNELVSHPFGDFLARLKSVFNRFSAKFNRPSLRRSSYAINKLFRDDDKLFCIVSNCHLDILLRKGRSTRVVVNKNSVVYINAILRVNCNPVRFSYESTHQSIRPEDIKVLPFMKPDLLDGLLWCSYPVRRQTVMKLALHIESNLSGKKTQKVYHLLGCPLAKWVRLVILENQLNKTAF